MRTIRTLLALAVVCTSGCDWVRDRMADRAAADIAAGDRRDWLSDDALHVILCGTGSPLADPERAGPCTAVIAAGRFFLVDVGAGSWENVQLWELPRARLSGVLLTHFHSDHIAELGEVVMQSWLAGRVLPLKVYGPPGAAEVVAGFRYAYAFDTGYRVSHHGERVMPPSGARTDALEIDAPPAGPSAPFVDAGGVRITAFRVDHTPVEPAYGYRFEYGGRSVVISGDTAKSENLIASARGADVIVHEALAAHLIGPVSKALKARREHRWAKLTADILDYHTTPVEAAEVARESGARLLVLTHLVPSPPGFVGGRLFLEGTGDAWDGEILLGHDGLHLRLPAESDEIEREDLG